MSALQSGIITIGFSIFSSNIKSAVQKSIIMMQAIRVPKMDFISDFCIS